MNTYFQAILWSTDNNKLPELGDAWRVYHPTARLSDSEGVYDDLKWFESEPIN